ALRIVQTSGRLGFFFQAEDGIRRGHVTGVQTCALPIYERLVFLPLREFEDEALVELGARIARAKNAELSLLHVVEIPRNLPPKRSEERRVGKEGRAAWSWCD